MVVFGIEQAVGLTCIVVLVALGGTLLVAGVIQGNGPGLLRKRITTIFLPACNSPIRNTRGACFMKRLFLICTCVAAVILLVAPEATAQTTTGVIDGVDASSAWV